MVVAVVIGVRGKKRPALIAVGLCQGVYRCPGQEWYPTLRQRRTWPGRSFVESGATTAAQQHRHHP